MKPLPFILALLLLIAQVASSGVQIKMVKAYEVTKWEYFKVGIKNGEGTQNLTVKVRVYDGAGYEKYRMLEDGLINYKEDGSAHMATPAFFQTASGFWEAGAYKEILLRWVISPCNCKRFKEYPVIVIIEVFRASDGMRLDAVTFVMWSEYYYGTR